MTSSITPFLWIILAAFIVAVPGLVLLFVQADVEVAPWQPKPRHPIRRLLGVLLLGLAALVCLLAFSLYRYLQLYSDRPVAVLEIMQEAPHQFIVRVGVFDNQDVIQRLERYTLHGDAWQLEARVMRWRLPAVLPELPSLYRLERISGRYYDVEDEGKAPRTVYAMNEWGLPDLLSLKHKYPRWLPFVEPVDENVTWMPMFDSARYTVLFNDRGRLLARATDTFTAEQLKKMDW